jgi:hypothetical protein
MMTKRSIKKLSKPVLAWGGFHADKLDVVIESGYDHAYTLLAVFRTRADAKRHFQDVRRIEIREVARPRR